MVGRAFEEGDEPLWTTFIERVIGKASEGESEAVSSKHIAAAKKETASEWIKTQRKQTQNERPYILH